MTELRACAVCGVDISGMRRDARVCRSNVCRIQSRTALPRKWATKMSKPCTVVENGELCGAESGMYRTTDHPMCNMHGTRKARHGNPLHVERNMRAHGEIQALMKQAAVYEGNDCFMIPNKDGGRLAVSYDGHAVTASRAVWMIANGDPGAAYVLHTCGNGDVGCASIRHLYLGTQTQNMADQLKDGTRVRGERHAHSKLSESNVRDIRRRAASGERQYTLAAEYGVSGPAISNIVTRKNWGWLTD